MNALIRYSNPFTALSSHLDDLFADNIFESIDRQLITGSWPKVDISESDKGYMIKADLPGMDKKDVIISVENGVLTITGEKVDENKKEKGKYYHLERSYGKFCRTFSLPDGVDQEKITASMKNGVLELEIIKSEKQKPKSIEIKVD
ncbi:MAG TPA: Hsp20/alpha crystallin family protein [Chitinispirillaceae bacterium]|nr:Hsp20/alpha crystallin family protein [Chitinispirillaceae bacterium]